MNRIHRLTKLLLNGLKSTINYWLYGRMFLQDLMKEVSGKQISKRALIVLQQSALLQHSSTCIYVIGVN